MRDVIEVLQWTEQSDNVYNQTLHMALKVKKYKKTSRATSNVGYQTGIRNFCVQFIYLFCAQFIYLFI